MARHLSIQTTTDLFPNLTPLERMQLYWFERRNVVETSKNLENNVYLECDNDPAIAWKFGNP